ncbi:response regulator [bacterium]|nr:response regulator [bacterium]
MKTLATLIAASSVELRSRVKEAIEATRRAQVPKIAATGRLAIQMLEHSSIDVVIAQAQMTDMNDGELFDELQTRGFTPHVIVLSESPGNAAKAAKDRLKHGRLHFIEGPMASGKPPTEEHFKRFIHQMGGIFEKITALQTGKPEARVENHEPEVGKIVVPGPESSPANNTLRVNLDSFKPHIICIGASTGGPAALEVVFSRMKGKSKVPILVVQHMPPGFTESLAGRIQLVSGLPAAEARPGEIVKAGHVYVAPGDYHMRLVMDEGDVAIHLDHGPKRNSVRPSVDFLFETASQIFQRNALAMVLTGMGEDGLVGAKAVKKNGGAVIIQDKDSSVVWGMPGAIHAAGAWDSMGDLERCADLLATMALKR